MQIKLKLKYFKLILDKGPVFERTFKTAKSTINNLITIKAALHYKKIQSQQAPP